MRRRIHSDVNEWPGDETLHRQIIESIHHDPMFWSGRGGRKTMIVVEVEEGYVTLNGIVRTAAERRRADTIARALGAVGVDNRLQLDSDVAERSM